MIKAIIFDIQGVIYIHHTLNQPLVDKISALSPDYKMALITNLSESGVRQYLDDIFLKLFEYIHYYGKDGLVKTQHETFTHVAHELGVEPEECVFIDDQFAYVEAATQAGMKAILFEDNKTFGAELNKILTSE